MRKANFQQNKNAACLAKILLGKRHKKFLNLNSLN